MKSLLFVALVAALACSSCSSETPAAEAEAAPDADLPDRAVSPPGEEDAASAEDAAHDAGPPLDVPASLISALGDKTYVEDACEPATYPGWPHPAQRCTYRNNLVVTIANPPPDRVARWVIEASTLIPSLDALHTRDRASWEAGLVVIAKHTIGQSSRIFPLGGQIYENGKVYVFERGITKTCTTGCYCRINSTSRPQWCAYAVNALQTETNEDACLAKFGQPSKTLPEPWLAHCIANHEAAWSSDRNEHYRAQAWNANRTLAQMFPDPAAANGADVVAALKTVY